MATAERQASDSTRLPTASTSRPLDGVVVVDVSRMLPGAVLARTLLELGARLIKIEDPRGGEPMRHAPPSTGNTSVAFSIFFRGAQSVALDLRVRRGADALRALTRRADVLVESFRPATLDRWGLGVEGLRAENPRLIVCSLPGFAPQSPGTNVGHDLNFVALSGLLSRLPEMGVPSVQLADVATGMLATSAILAALLVRSKTGTGVHLVQPIAAAPLPFLWWGWADAAAGSPLGMTNTIIGGACAAYRLYRCNDGRYLAVGCLEPKFWSQFCNKVGLPAAIAGGLDLGRQGEEAARSMAAHLGAHERAHWLHLLEGENLPVTAVHDVEAASHEPSLERLTEVVVLPDGRELRLPGPALPSVGRIPEEQAPRLGEHTDMVLREMGFDEAGNDRVH